MLETSLRFLCESDNENVGNNGEGEDHCHSENTGTTYEVKETGKPIDSARLKEYRNGENLIKLMF